MKDEFEEMLDTPEGLAEEEMLLNVTNFLIKMFSDLVMGKKLFKNKDEIEQFLALQGIKIVAIVREKDNRYPREAFRIVPTDEADENFKKMQGENKHD